MKSVAIIGAGPAGLVAAKTLIHSYPKDTFSVSVFEHGKTVGGLWAVEANPQGMISSEMRTNLSQFTVCFSDLAWESLELQPPPNIYPKGWQVNRYLERYSQKFIPAGVIAFQTRVKTVDRIQLGWRLTVIGVKNKVEEIKIFDCLVVASGFFSEPRQLNFELGHMDNQPSIVHSSEYRRLGNLSTTGQQPSTGKVLVVGGSHSGSEVAATIALQMSDACHSPSGSGIKPLEIIHVMPHPLVAIPTFVQTGKSSSPTFLPLDSLLYELSSRPEDPVAFQFAHNSTEKIKGLRDILGKLMDGSKSDSDEEKNASELSQTLDTVSPYAVVSDTYVEFVRSGAIRPVLGRLLRLEGQDGKDSQKTAFMQAKLSPGSDENNLEDITAVVNATGFSSSPALDFMPKSILDTLDYETSYPRLPLLLHRDALTSSNNSPNNLAVMGSFDGSYWGVLETQARVIANKWAQNERSKSTQPDGKWTKLYTHQKELRQIMNDDPDKIPQNFFGDYPGLMEETSRDIALRKIDLAWVGKEGMVTPARYVDGGCDIDEAVKTMGKLQKILNTSTNLQAFSAKAVFRALLGKWEVKSKSEGSLDPVLEALPTTAVFHPRYPTDSTSDYEYLFVLRGAESDESAIPTSRDLQKLVYRLREMDNVIEVWDVNLGVTADKMRHTIEFNTATSSEQSCLTVSLKSAASLGQQMRNVYSFYFGGVHITKFTVQSYSDDQDPAHTSMLDFFRAAD